MFNATHFSECPTIEVSKIGQLFWFLHFSSAKQVNFLNVQNTVTPICRVSKLCGVCEVKTTEISKPEQALPVEVMPSLLLGSSLPYSSIVLLHLLLVPCALNLANFGKRKPFTTMLWLLAETKWERIRPWAYKVVIWFSLTKWKVCYTSGYGGTPAELQKELNFQNTVSICPMRNRPF